MTIIAILCSGLEPGSTPPIKYEDFSRWKTHSRFKIWLSVLKFHSAGLEDKPSIPGNKEEEDCRTQLQIWDANVRSSSMCQDYWYVFKGVARITVL